MGTEQSLKQMKKHGKKCQDRGEKEKVEKGLAKNLKVSGREGSTRKRTTFKPRDCGDVCRGEDRGI